MTRHKSFTTAAARRRLDPIVWEIDGTTIRLRASVDLDEIAEAAESLQAPIENEQSMSGIVARRASLVAVVETFVDPADLDAFRALAPSLDLAMLVEMSRDSIAEYAGLGNSGQDSSSSDGSSPTGPSSTAGALPAA